MQIVDRHLDAPWLPEGGVAEVVLAGPGEEVPGPVGLVRLLLSDAGGRIFCVPRTGGRPGVDIPTESVGRSGAGAAIDELTVTIFGRRRAVHLVGAVRNVVPVEAEYEWPSPVTYFCVYRPTAVLVPRIDGVWLPPEAAFAELSERHWWPLVAATRQAKIGPFWELVDSRVTALLAADDPRQAYEIAMEVACLEFNDAWHGAIDFDGAFYCHWIELSDLFDKPWWTKRLGLEEAEQILREAGREWLETPVDARRVLLARWQERLGLLADEVRSR